MQLIVNLIGLGLGPLTVGILSDTYALAGLGAGEALRWSLLTSSVVGLAGAGAYVLAGMRLREEVVS